MNIIDCKKIRTEMLIEAQLELTKIYADTGKRLKLVVIQVSGDDASDIYIQNKNKTAEQCGIDFEYIKLPNNICTKEVREVIKAANRDPEVTSVMLQLPLPYHLKPYEQSLIDEIAFNKDCDGLSTKSIGRLWTNQPCVHPATAEGILRLLPKDLSNKRVAIINRSALIGKPLLKLLSDRNAIVSLFHSKVSLSNIYDDIIWCDYVITATGVSGFIKSYGTRIFEDVTIIDAGMCRNEQGKLCGDVDVESLKETNGSVTPTPNGTGILTTAQLMLNVIKCYKLQKGRFV